MKDDLNGSNSVCEFDLRIAKAIGNRVLQCITYYLWHEQQDSPMWIKLIEMMKDNKLDSVILEDHQNLLDALHRTIRAGAINNI